MKIKIISCWFATSYGAYSDNLRTALEKKIGSEVGVIASNCGCGDPVEVARKFQNKRCEYFEFPHVPYFKSKNPVKYWFRVQARNLIYKIRAKKYLDRTYDSEILHFQQTLNGYGFNVVFNWLQLPSRAKKIVTVHEFDSFQKDFPEKTRIYNKADHIIVLFEEMKNELVKLNVKPEKISVIAYGVEITPFENEKKEGIIFYGGHFIGKGKGADALFRAMVLIKNKLGDATPVLRIHGHWGEQPPAEGVVMAIEHGIERNIIWLNQLNSEQTIEAYKKSLLCVLPYKGSSAGLAAVHAMAYGVPVIATRKAGLPDHLGEVGTYINEDAPDELADEILRLCQNEAVRNEISIKGRIRAEKFFSWDSIADQTMKIYSKVLV